MRSRNFGLIGVVPVRRIVVSAPLPAGAALAQETTTVSGHVRDNQANPVVGAEVRAVDPTTQEVVGSVLSDSVGAYYLVLSPGTYDLEVIPSEGSGLGAAVCP